MSALLSSPLLMEIVYQMAGLFLNMFGTGSNASGWKLPLLNSGISLSVSTGTEPGGHTITLHFSGLSPAHAGALQSALVSGSGAVDA